MNTCSEDYFAVEMFLQLFLSWHMVKRIPVLPALDYSLEDICYEVSMKGIWVRLRLNFPFSFWKLIQIL